MSRIPQGMFLCFLLSVHLDGVHFYLVAGVVDTTCLNPGNAKHR